MEELVPSQAAGVHGVKDSDSIFRNPSNLSKLNYISIANLAPHLYGEPKLAIFHVRNNNLFTEHMRWHQDLQKCSHKSSKGRTDFQQEIDDSVVSMTKYLQSLKASSLSP